MAEESNSSIQFSDPKRFTEYHFNVLKLGPNVYSFDLDISDLVKYLVEEIHNGPQESLYLVLNTPYFKKVLLGLKPFDCNGECPLGEGMKEVCLEAYYIWALGSMFAKTIVEEGEIYIPVE
jgi:hypothetical protein